MSTKPFEPPKEVGTPQFGLWRLLASVLSFALAFGLFRIAAMTSAEYGTAAFTWLLVIGGVLLIAAAVGVLFRRALLWAGSVALRLLHLFLSG